MTMDLEEVVTTETLRAMLGDYDMYVDSPEPVMQEVEEIFDEDSKQD
jgi:hypothetical protein